MTFKWDADFVKAFIPIEDSKSGKARKVPMNAPGFDRLRELKHESEFVFQSMHTRGQVQPLGDMKRSFKGACRRAGIKGLGHASIQMTMRYAHPTPENMRLAVEQKPKERTYAA